MPGAFDGLRRVVSPVTLLLGVLCFLLPFCALSCGGTDLVRVSGVNLAVGGDAKFNCDALDQLGSSLNNAFGNSFASSSSSSSTSTSTSGTCGTGSSSGASSSSQSTGPQKLGPFDRKGSSDSSVHVAEQPLAAIAVVLLILGAVVGFVKGRTGALGGLVLGLAAALALVSLRILAAGSFNTDVTASASASSSGNVSSSSTSISGINLGGLSPFELTWGAGWWLALTLAAIGAGISAIALFAGGHAAGPAGAAAWSAPGPYGRPPPQQPNGQPPPPHGQPPPPQQYGQPPPFGQQPPQYGQPPLPGPGGPPPPG